MLWGFSLPVSLAKGRDMAAALITLITDFGTSDGYPAMMEGVIRRIAPSVDVVNVTHKVPPQDVSHASFVLGRVARAFPTETIHVIVVDPGVGTARRALILTGPGGSRFVGPDNGVFSHVLAWGGLPAPEVRARRYMSPYRAKLPGGFRAHVIEPGPMLAQERSVTFHGRDVFAPAAAHLASGHDPSEFGSSVDEVTALHLPAPEVVEREIRARIQYVDGFGNLVTDVPAEALAETGAAQVVSVGGKQIKGLSASYADGDGLGALVGSHGFLEIFMTNGSAARALNANVADPVSVASSGIRG